MGGLQQPTPDKPLNVRTVNKRQREDTVFHQWLLVTISKLEHAANTAHLSYPFLVSKETLKSLCSMFEVARNSRESDKALAKRLVRAIKEQMVGNGIERAQVRLEALQDDWKMERGVWKPTKKMWTGVDLPKNGLTRATMKAKGK